MKVKIVCRKVYDYVRYDLKEIAFPSSLPDPPHFQKRRKLTWHERFLVLKEASRLYAASWVRDIGPELNPKNYRKDDDDVIDDTNNQKKKGKTPIVKEDPTVIEDLAVAARGGMETLRPALQRVYMTRASAYRDALKSFIQGYQEGVHQWVVHLLKKLGRLNEKQQGFVFSFRGNSLVDPESEVGSYYWLTGSLSESIKCL
ncbi:hypothetical protein ACFE04_002211 [Oxalis oulophora]